MDRSGHATYLVGVKKRNYAARVSFGEGLGLSKAEARQLALLDTPAKVQDFVSAIPINFEPGGDTLRSVGGVLKARRAHCLEGAMVAACALYMAGREPLLLDLVAEGDSDHVVALFRENGCWGAISKSNHATLRGRDPVYRTLRELAMSYFHEYTNKKGQKSLRRHSAAFDLRRFKPSEWVTNKDDCWDIGAAVDDARHFPLISSAQKKLLRKADAMEQKAGKLLQYKKPALSTSARRKSAARGLK